jgi:integrase/recombinase XerD
MLADLSKFKFEPAIHNDKEIILIKFPYDLNLIRQVKELPSAKWIASKKSWYVADL